MSTFDANEFGLQLSLARESAASEGHLHLDWAQWHLEHPYEKHPRKFDEARGLEAHLRTMPHGTETVHNGVTVKREDELQYLIKSPGPKSQPGTYNSAHVGGPGGGLPADYNSGMPQPRSHGAPSAAWKAVMGYAHANPDTYQLMKEGAVPPVTPAEHHERRLALRSLDSKAEKAHAQTYGRLRPASSATHPSLAEHRDLEARLAAALDAKRSQTQARVTSEQGISALSQPTKVVAVRKPNDLVFDGRLYDIALSQARGG